MRTATEIAQDVRAGRRTARQETEYALARIEAADSGLGAYQEVRVFAALREADEVDARVVLEPFGRDSGVRARSFGNSSSVSFRWCRFSGNSST